jgi:hypothetical protein
VASERSTRSPLTRSRLVTELLANRNTRKNFYFGAVIHIVYMYAVTKQSKFSFGPMNELEISTRNDEAISISAWPSQSRRAVTDPARPSRTSRGLPRESITLVRHPHGRSHFAQRAFTVASLGK